MPELLVMGDSILWGQGLPEEDKCTSVLRRRWSAAIGQPVSEYRFAHSGADIWDDGQSGVLAALDPDPPRFPPILPGDPAVLRTRPCERTPPLRDAIGEIPDEEPYLLRQILDARTMLSDVFIDLVVVDMGINDTEIFNLVLPGKSLAAVVARARSLAPRVRHVLDKIGATFPGAKILVTGYYPIVSKESDLSEVFQFASAVVDAALREDVDVPWLGRLAQHPFLRRIEHDVAVLFSRDLASRSAAWTAAMHEVLQAAVAAFDGGRGIAAFVDPEFRPEHAIFAPDSLLWPFVDGQPQDPMAAKREQWCVDNGVTGFERLAVERASLGHPGPAGALRYADALFAHATALGLFRAAAA
jgi:hypothetical protein